MRYLSLYEFWWKFRQLPWKLCRASSKLVLMVTPGFSADCASALHDRHNDYCRSAVVAHFRLMPTKLRHRRLEACILQDPERLELDESDPRRTIQWGATQFEEHGGRFLGVADLVRKFDTDEVDGKGRTLG